MSIRTARPGKPDFDQKVRLGILAATLAFREISPARDDPVPDPESLMWKPIQLLNGRADACRHLVAVKLKLADVLGRSLVIHETGDDYTDNPENRSAVSPWRLSQELSGST